MLATYYTLRGKQYNKYFLIPRSYVSRQATAAATVGKCEGKPQALKCLQAPVLLARHTDSVEIYELLLFTLSALVTHIRAVVDTWVLA